MYVLKMSYPAASQRLKKLASFREGGDTVHEVGTAFLKRGTRMPDHGASRHCRREVSFILEGRLRTTSGGKTVTLGPGDVVSIPKGQAQYSEVLADTRLIYVFLGE